MHSLRQLFSEGSIALLAFVGHLACTSEAANQSDTLDKGGVPGGIQNGSGGAVTVDGAVAALGGISGDMTATSPPNQGALGGAGGVPPVGGSANGASTGSTGSVIDDAGSQRGSVRATSDSGAQLPAFPMLTASQLGQPTRITTSFSLSLAEGPLWDPCEHRLLFVDVTASKIYSMTPDDQITLFASNTGNANGIAFAPDGSLILPQMARPGHISRRDKSGTITPLEPPGSFLHTPDDCIVRSDGVIYFTDGDFPPVGGLDTAPLPVYALLPGASQLDSGGTVPGPNGIELSPDEKTLYVNAFYGGAVVKYNVMPDGTITKGSTLAMGLQYPDSMCLDAVGNLYIAVHSGLAVLRPDGSSVGLIPVPVTTGVTNCDFGGDDGTTLYITAYTTIWKIPGMPIPGLEWWENRRRLKCQ
jgi:gluconolactonase